MRILCAFLYSKRENVEVWRKRVDKRRCWRQLWKTVRRGNMVSLHGWSLGQGQVFMRVQRVQGFWVGH